MSELNISGANVGNALQELLMCEDLQPGDPASYQQCKTIYSYHPLGGKLADYPIAMAQSQPRKISVPKGPEERLVEAFEEEWRKVGADRHIFNCARLARIYGIASIALLSDGTPSDRPVDFKGLAEADIGFNVLDPLNTSGSLVLNQNPNSIDFQKVQGITVNGKPYHRSRTVTVLNEDPLYIEWSTSAFGYVGRSVYQRALFPLKSFINTQVANDMVASKAGVLVTKIKQQSSVIDGLMSAVGAVKRSLLQLARNGNVIQVGHEDAVESLDLQNLDKALTTARRHIIEDIASSSSTPAKILLSETFAAGFGEGTEDAKHVAQFVDRIRVWMEPLYAFFDKVVQYRAWNPRLYKSLQAEFPERYKDVAYTQAFYEWTNSFKATWPSLIEEPDSEKVKVSDTKLKAAIAIVEVLAPELDPENKAALIRWLAENVSAEKMLFTTPLELDYDALAEYVPPEPMKELDAPEPFSAQDRAYLVEERVRLLGREPARRLR
jgi:hypothetical protein